MRKQRAEEGVDYRGPSPGSSEGANNSWRHESGGAWLRPGQKGTGFGSYPDTPLLFNPGLTAEGVSIWIAKLDTEPCLVPTKEGQPPGPAWSPQLGADCDPYFLCPSETT